MFVVAYEKIENSRDLHNVPPTCRTWKQCTKGSNNSWCYQCTHKANKRECNLRCRERGRGRGRCRGNKRPRTSEKGRGRGPDNGTRATKHCLMTPPVMEPSNPEPHKPPALDQPPHQRRTRPGPATGRPPQHQYLPSHLAVNAAYDKVINHNISNNGNSSNNNNIRRVDAMQAIMKVAQQYCGSATYPTTQEVTDFGCGGSFPRRF